MNALMRSGWRSITSSIPRLSSCPTSNKIHLHIPPSRLSPTSSLSRLSRLTLTFLNCCLTSDVAYHALLNIQRITRATSSIIHRTSHITNHITPPSILNKGGTLDADNQHVWSSFHGRNITALLRLRGYVWVYVYGLDSRLPLRREHSSRLVLLPAPIYTQRRLVELTLFRLGSVDSTSTSTPLLPAHISLPALPSELIDHILSYLDPIDLTSVSLVSRCLYAHAVADHLWQDIVQSNVPGVKLTTSYPCPSFRELYVAHDPRWFLTKYKLWFGDRDLTGKLIIVRYDERRGVIEGYQLLATREPSTSHISGTTTLNANPDADVEIHDFAPQLKLHLDKPVLQIRANSLENTIRTTARRSSTPSVKGIPVASSPPSTAAASSFNKFSAETPMPLDDRYNDTMFNTFMLARALPDSAPSVEQRRDLPFPYGNIWPPPAIPATERVSSAHFMRDGGDSIAQEERPTRRAEISQKSFRIRSWMEMRPAGLRGVSMGWLRASLFAGDGAREFDSGGGVFGQASRPWLTGPYAPGVPVHGSVGAHIGDTVSTYSTLDPEVYTPTADQPWKGIWVGDYSTHGCEFLLIKQDHPTPFDEAAFDATRDAGETDADFVRRKTDARRYRGSLEAVKLTGDPNVPRGECTFFASDLGDDGYVTTVEEEPFLGARVVQSKGHIARAGFTHGKQPSPA